MTYTYCVAFVIGSLFTTAARLRRSSSRRAFPSSRLVEAHAKNALAASAAEVAGHAASRAR